MHFRISHARKTHFVQSYVPWTSTSTKTVATMSVGQVATKNLKLNDEVQSLSAELKARYNQSSHQSESDRSGDTEAYTVIELLSCFSFPNAKETQAKHRLLPLPVGRDTNTSRPLTNF